MQLCLTENPPTTAFDATKPAIHCLSRPEVHLLSNCRDNFKKTVTFDNKNVLH